ncbi:MAG: 50S ribosomal protein L24 [Thaumarchaeota archaeon]|nr:50S ribosomal protein L24 [Nitrososphaerota archaeon]
MGRGDGSVQGRALSAHLSDELSSEYGIRSLRVRVGDVVKVMRGSYKGVEGRVLRVYPKEGRLAIEGLNRQNSRGESVPIKVHASKVMLIRLNLEDKLRREKLESLKSRASGTGEGEAHG